MLNLDKTKTKYIIMAVRQGKGGGGDIFPSINKFSVQNTKSARNGSSMPEMMELIINRLGALASTHPSRIPVKLIAR
jgi:hypothetical protein